MLHCFFRFEGKGIRRELLSSAIVAMKRCKTNKQSTNFVSLGVIILLKDQKLMFLLFSPDSSILLQPLKNMLAWEKGDNRKHHHFLEEIMHMPTLLYLEVRKKSTKCHSINFL